MFNGKMKAITFSYDDGTTQDIRLAEMFHKYGLKATFNINSELLGKERTLLRDGKEILHNKIHPNDLKYVFEGHEIAGHTLTHPRLTTIEEDDEVVRQVEEDRLRLSDLCGYEVVGFAYPCGGVNFDRRVSELIKNRTGAQYCRTIVANGSFDLQDNLYEFNPTVHHVHYEDLFAQAERFLSMTADKPQIFYVWGHSFEFDIENDWDRFEEFCRLVSGRPDIFYGTNREVLLNR